MKCIHTEDRKRVMAILDQAIANAKAIDTTFRIITKRGNIRVIELHASAVRNDELHFIGISMDITKRQFAEDHLQLANNVFQYTHDGVMITDDKQLITYVNPRFTELSGYHPNEAIGQTPKIFRSNIHNRNFYIGMWQKIEQQGYWCGEVWNRHKNGSLYAEMLTISKVQNSNGKVVNYVALLSDITTLKQKQWDLDRIGHYDSLTQLPNRVLLESKMQKAIAHALQTEQLLAICCLDLDGFKPINDQYGHDLGDQLLYQVGKRLSDCIGSYGSVSRIGGDEFVLLLEDLRDLRACEGL
ncbi:hypothetical protein TI03_03820, partial [Achromatium sp. WMS1]